MKFSAIGLICRAALKSILQAILQVNTKFRWKLNFLHIKISGHMTVYSYTIQHSLFLIYYSSLKEIFQNKHLSKRIIVLSKHKCISFILKLISLINQKFNENGIQHFSHGSHLISLYFDSVSNFRNISLCFLFG